MIAFSQEFLKDVSRRSGLLIQKSKAEGYCKEVIAPATENNWNNFHSDTDNDTNEHNDKLSSAISNNAKKLSGVDKS